MENNNKTEYEKARDDWAFKFRLQDDEYFLAERRMRQRAAIEGADWATEYGQDDVQFLLESLERIAMNDTVLMYKKDGTVFNYVVPGAVIAKRALADFKARRKE